MGGLFLLFLVFIPQFSKGNSRAFSKRETRQFSSTESDVTFTLYNRNFSEGTVITLNDTDAKLRSAFIASVPTKMITHGWLITENSSSVADIRTAYSRTEDLNIITVGWSRLSQNEYVLARRSAGNVGVVVGRFTARLVDIGLATLEQVHLIGHSLGAHVMGVAGGWVRDSGRGQVARVTGLDPAGPLYQGSSEDERLDSNDGQFVDAIHTCIGIFGFTNELGNADFYPNGGYCFQPGCQTSTDIFCGHKRAFQIFVLSIFNASAFPAVQCSSYIQFKLNQCQGDIVYMGNPTPPSARGTYYL